MSWVAGSGLSGGRRIWPSTSVRPNRPLQWDSGSAGDGSALSQLHPSLLGRSDTKSHLLTTLVVPRP